MAPVTLNVLFIVVAPSTVNVLPTVAIPAISVWDVMALAPPCICIISSTPPVSDEETPNVILPISDSSVTSVAVTLMLANDWRLLELSLARNLNSPAVSLFTPALLPLAFESFIIAPVASLELFLILTDGNKLYAFLWTTWGAGGLPNTLNFPDNSAI